MSIATDSPPYAAIIALVGCGFIYTKDYCSFDLKDDANGGTEWNWIAANVLQ